MNCTVGYVLPHGNVCFMYITRSIYHGLPRRGCHSGNRCIVVDLDFSVPTLWCHIMFRLHNDDRVIILRIYVVAYGDTLSVAHLFPGTFGIDRGMGATQPSTSDTAAVSLGNLNRGVLGIQFDDRDVSVFKFFFA